MSEPSLRIYTYEGPGLALACIIIVAAYSEEEAIILIKKKLQKYDLKYKPFLDEIEVRDISSEYIYTWSGDY